MAPVRDWKKGCRIGRAQLGGGEMYPRLILALSLALAGCAGGGTHNELNPYPVSGPTLAPRFAKVPQRALSPQELETVKNGILAQLKDPDSAKFGIMIAGTERDGSLLICGLVNSRNSFGGYTGALPFQMILVNGTSRG
jgi:hypothetical protein